VNESQVSSHYKGWYLWYSRIRPSLGLIIWTKVFHPQHILLSSFFKHAAHSVQFFSLLFLLCWKVLHFELRKSDYVLPLNEIRFSILSFFFIQVSFCTKVEEIYFELKEDVSWIFNGKKKEKFSFKHLFTSFSGLVTRPKLRWSMETSF
jgi:hypothetical protein